MKKDELVAAISGDAGITRTQAQAAVEAFTTAVQKALEKGEKVNLPGFGSFKVSQRAARDGRNPVTGKPIKIPAKKVARFSPGKKLKDALE